MASDLQTGDLRAVLEALLKEAAPRIFSGSPPQIALSAPAEVVVFTDGPVDSAEPRRESVEERLAFDLANPSGPYRLARSPAPGGRLVRLLQQEVVATALSDAEVDWTSGAAPEDFTLQLRPGRSVSGITGIQVVYGVNAVVTTLTGRAETQLTLTGKPADLPSARGLLVAVLTLEAERLLAHSVTTTGTAGYTTRQRPRTLTLMRSEITAPIGDVQSALVAVASEVNLEVRRDLRAGEGAPIERILTPGTAGGAAISVEPGVGA